MAQNSESASYFEWTHFYEEFADKLLTYRNNREELIFVIHKIASSNPGYLIDHLTDIYKDGTDGPLKDICPFSTLGLFNRVLTDERRRAIAGELAHFLEVELTPPTTFEGIPVLQNLKLLFFFPERVREPDDIDSLWDVFSNAIHLADYGDYRPFIQSYNKAVRVKGVGWNLTSGLYWIRPRTFQSLFPSKLRTYIRDDLKTPVDNRITNNAEAYLSLMDILQEKFQDPDCPVHSYQELSLAADMDDNERHVIFPIEQADKSKEEARLGSELYESVQEYTLDHILKDGCFLEKAKLSEILDRLKSKKNLIFQGPPGTGKTWLAKRLAYALIGRQDADKVRSVQFHPNLSYEDFIRGWRPSSDGKLDLVDGPFIEVIDAAREDQSSRHVIVIEEINRGNPAQILGEMLTLLESDKRTPGEALELTYRKHKGERVHIPENLYVIGTMNMADRSLAMVDFALRRRFAFVNMEPELGEPWLGWVHEQSGIDRDALLQIKTKLDSLNQAIADDPNLGPQFRIGHSFVTPNDKIDNANNWFRQVVETEIGPLLDEYWYDDREKAQEERSRLLSGI